MTTTSYAAAPAASGNAVLLLVARILLVLLFFMSAFGMVSSPEGSAGYFASLGIPAAGAVVWLVIIWKVVLSLMVLVGWNTRIAAWGMALFCIGAALIGHHGIADPNEMTQLLKDFAIAGGFLALSAAGPGRIAVSARP